MGEAHKLRDRLDKLRDEHGSSHNLVHSVPSLWKVYQERLTAFEDGVAQMVADGACVGRRERGRGVAQKRAIDVCPFGLFFFEDFSLFLN